MGYNNTAVKILGNCVTVARQTLTLFVGVRIPIPQPNPQRRKSLGITYYLFTIHSSLNPPLGFGSNK